jgi:glycosyltransferase involved in cell wall biosynthesis
MTVLYYTSTPFLDIAIEKINILKKDVDLHVLIELTPGSAFRIGINKVPDNQTIISSSELLSEENYKYLKPYFDGCASTNFIVHTSDTGFSLSTIKVSFIAWRYVTKIQPDIIQLEALTLRSLGLLPFLFSSKKIFLTIHDSILHSGEESWKISLPRFLYLRIPYSKSYFFYSNFSKNQFEQYYKKDKHPKFVLRMYPYTFYKKHAKEEIPNKKHILFFGRLSHYKGIDVLLNAMPLVFKEFPNETLIIAGSSENGYNLDKVIIEKYKSRIIILNRYIPNKELVTLIQESKFVVCPYLDATQSGVLMTSYALNTPVVATNVGAFIEYIEQNVTGILIPANNPSKLADAIKLALQNNFYKTMEESISKKNKTNMWINNKDIILDAYLS